MNASAAPGPSRALVLGAADEAEEMAAALRRLGVEVAVADDRGLDTATVRDILSQFPAEVVVPVGSLYDDHLLDHLESTGVAIAPGPQAVRLTGRRDAQLRFASEQLGLPVARFATARTAVEVEQAANVLGYPCVVSPATAGSGTSSVVTSGVDVAAAFGRAGGAEVVVEQQVAADAEIVMLAVSTASGRAQGPDVIHFCEPIGVRRRADGRLAEAWQPQETTEGEYDAARSVAARITRAAGGRGVFAVRLLVRRGDVYFAGIDVGPAAAGVVTLRSQVLDQWALHARAVLGAPCEATMSSPAAAAACGRRVRVADVAAVLAVPESGLWLCEDTGEHSPWQHGALIASAESTEQAREHVAEMARRAHL